MFMGGGGECQYKVTELRGDISREDKIEYYLIILRIILIILNVSINIIYNIILIEMFPVQNFALI